MVVKKGPRTAALSYQYRSADHRQHLNPMLTRKSSEAENNMAASDPCDLEQPFVRND